MIFPAKHIRPERAIIGVGAELLEILSEPMTVSRLWDEIRTRREENAPGSPITYNWFVLSLDFLYMIRAIDFRRGLLVKGGS